MLSFAHPARVVHATTLDYGFLKDAFVDARSAALGEAMAIATPGPFAALTQPAVLARGSRSAVAFTRASIFEDRLDGVELSRWGLVTGWGPLGIGLAYSKLEWGTIVVPENFFTLAPERSFDVVEDEYRAGLGISLARALHRDGPVDLELGLAASRFHVQVPSSGDPDVAVPGEVARLGPVVELRAGFQRGSSRHRDPGTWETGWFGEIEVLGILSARRGHVRAPAYGIDDDTLGFGVVLDWDSLPLGVRQDWAERPLVRFAEGGVVIDRFGSSTSGAGATDEHIYTLAVTFGRPR